jgi:hypothetical protein
MPNFLRCLVAIVALNLSIAHAADFSALVTGQPVPDNIVKIGRFQLQLPAGTWTVAAISEMRSGSQSGSSGSPTQLSITVAQVNSDKARALLIFRTPASSFIGVNRWNDDPCGAITDALVKDTMKQTFAMPECFAVLPFSPGSITSATSGAFSDITKWMKATKVSLPESLLRVYYTKYRGGDFIHANMYLAGTRETHAAAEAWGREVAAAIAKMVTGDSPMAILPTLPALAAAPQ